MTLIRLSWIALTAATVAAAQGSSHKARGVILGTVADTGLRPVAGADVNVAGSNVRVSTDSLGRFRIVDIPAGKFVLIVRNIGFRPATNEIEVAENDTLRLAFELEPTVNELATIVVTERKLSAKLEAFEERRKLGFGEFFTTADIEKAQPLRVSDVLRRAKSVRIKTGISAEVAVSAREVTTCPMAVYLDQIPLGAINLLDLPSTKDIAAIEIYAGSATLPLWLPKGPYGTQIGCGAILVWTRDGS